MPANTQSIPPSSLSRTFSQHNLKRRQPRKISYIEVQQRITEIADEWGRDTELSPGWKPTEWAENFLVTINEEVWTQQDAATQTLIIKFLSNPGLSSDIHCESFVSR